jgi:hypothetical protein
MSEYLSRDLGELLHENGVSDRLIPQVIESGYFLKGWFTGNNQPHITVSDSLYGNKSLSSKFEIADFIRHLNGERIFEPLPPLNRIRVRNCQDIYEYMREIRLQRYQANGSLTMRGQPREHHLRRAVPNPVRANSRGEEVSILPGLYRQTSGNLYNFLLPIKENFSISNFRNEIEDTDDADTFQHNQADFFRVEQHYANQTSGLDVTFDIESAIFFATHQFITDDKNISRYEPTPRGEHKGVIYLFVFGSPSVRRSEFLIQGFEYFKKRQPTRILRQICGLPNFSTDERNIALTDVDTVIELEPDFNGKSSLSREYMFPNTKDDSFYEKLLEIKDRHPDYLDKIVEYSWAR